MQTPGQQIVSDEETEIPNPGALRRSRSLDDTQHGRATQIQTSITPAPTSVSSAELRLDSLSHGMADFSIESEPLAGLAYEVSALRNT